MIEAVGVVIPANDEEDLLPSCLAAMRQATRVLHQTVHVIVVADACTDRTAERARQGGAAVLEIQAQCVGAARRAGMREVLSRTWQLDPDSVWLATTDADTLVPPGWLGQHLHYAAAGWDAIAGIVAVTDWAQHPPGLPPLFDQHYHTGPGPHPHVHGANLGFRASAYLAAGGFPASRTAEDHALVESLAAAGRRVLRTTEISVLTSARRQARAPRGFSHLLATLAIAVQPGTA